MRCAKAPPKIPAAGARRCRGAARPLRRRGLAAKTTCGLGRTRVTTVGNEGEISGLKADLNRIRPMHSLNILGGLGDYFYWWQALLLLALIGLIVLWLFLRKKG